MTYHSTGKGWPENKKPEGYPFFPEPTKNSGKVPDIKPRRPGVFRATKLYIYDRDEGKCVFCLSKITLNDMTLDHLIPRSRGGSNFRDNLALCCTKCNQAKGHTLPLMFILERDQWFQQKTLRMMIRRNRLRKLIKRYETEIKYLTKAIENQEK